MFDPSYNWGLEREVRVYLIKQIADIIITNNVESKEAILSFLDTDGKFYSECIDILNELTEENVPENEIALLDKTISNQLKYSTIVENSNKLSDMLVNIQNENYDNLEDAIGSLEVEIDTVNRDIKSARESLQDSKHDIDLSSNGFISVLDGIIQKDRNPSSKIKTGIQYLNTMLNGGFEKGRLYCALGVAKGWKSF